MTRRKRSASWDAAPDSPEMGSPAVLPEGSRPAPADPVRSVPGTVRSLFSSAPSEASSAASRFPLLCPLSFRRKYRSPACRRGRALQQGCRRERRPVPLPERQKTPSLSEKQQAPSGPAPFLFDFFGQKVKQIHFFRSFFPRKALPFRSFCPAESIAFYEPPEFPLFTGISGIFIFPCTLWIPRFGATII